MRISFSKYQGAGNDFILIDNRKLDFPTASSERISALCHRHYGIGADGLILLEPSSLADYKMRIFNSDGKEVDMCGNGLRCLIAFIRSLQIPSPKKPQSPEQERYQIETRRTVFSCHAFPSSKQEKIAVLFPRPAILHWKKEIAVEGESIECYVVDSGVPHAVVFVSSLKESQEEAMLSSCFSLPESIRQILLPMSPEKARERAPLARALRGHPSFAPEGVNVNFVMPTGKNSVAIRTYERGVEGETLACGTGAVAVAFVLFTLCAELKSLLLIPSSGEVLEVELIEEEGLRLTGPAALVFEGSLTL